MSTEPLCAHAHSCELYPRFSLKGALRIWQKRYCGHATAFKKCERYLLASQGESVPATLLPNGQHIK